MCEVCFKVAARMPSCRGCQHAWFCSAECQKAAWRDGHKAECRALSQLAASRGTRLGLDAFALKARTGPLMQVRATPVEASRRRSLSDLGPYEYHLPQQPKGWFTCRLQLPCATWHLRPNPASRSRRRAARPPAAVPLLARGPRLCAGQRGADGCPLAAGAARRLPVALHLRGGAQVAPRRAAERHV